MRAVHPHESCKRRDVVRQSVGGLLYTAMQIEGLIVLRSSTPRCICWRSAGAGQRGWRGRGGEFDRGCISHLGVGELSDQQRNVRVQRVRRRLQTGNTPQTTIHKSHSMRSVYTRIRSCVLKYQNARGSRLKVLNCAQSSPRIYTRVNSCNSPPYSHVRCGQSLQALS